MTDPERTAVAEQLLAVIFSLRTDNSEAGQAWTLSIATTALVRAILASIGPAGDPAALLALAQDQVATQVAAAQSTFFRKRVTIDESSPFGKMPTA